MKRIANQPLLTTCCGIKRGKASARKQAIKDILATLEEGHILMVGPCSKNEKELREFNKMQRILSY